MKPFSRLACFAKPARRFGAGASLLLVSSCALPSLGPTIAKDDVSAAIHADYSVNERDKLATRIGQSPDTAPTEGVIQQIGYEEPATGSGEVREWPALPVGQVHPFAPPVNPAAHTVGPCQGPECYPTEPRIALPTQSLSLKNCPMPWEQTREVPVPICEPEIWADEYLCDGGDRGLPVHYHGREMAGLETEDTVAEYVDSAGEPQLRPSTRVCVYAPQFASVRSISTPETGLAIGRAAGAHDGLSMAGLKNRRAVQLELKTDQPIGIDVRSRVSGLDLDMATDSMEQIAKVVNHVKLVNLFEERAFFQRVELDQTEEAYLAYGLLAAVEWTRDLNPIIVASDVGGQEVTARFKAEEYTGVEDKRTPGDLKIIKLADRHHAHPGDIVTFTIHYDNIGQRDLTEVRIIDNLTPRLEYIEGSADSDRDGRLLVDDNEEGSLVLTFELSEPLPGETGGTITFQARVR